MPWRKLITEINQAAMKQVSLLFVVLVTICSCATTAEYKDGQYCGRIKYHNSHTGTVSTYELPVKVEAGKLTVIYWPSGGWLDDSHFTPKVLDKDGYVRFVSDKGYDYEVTIIGKGRCGS